MPRLAPALVLLLAASGCAFDTGVRATAGPPRAADGPTAGERALLRALVAFARDPSAGRWAAVPATRRVRLGLGVSLVAARPRPALADPEAWKLSSSEPFRAATGPFSALRALAASDRVALGAGRHARCASPAGPAPGAVAHLRLLSLQPERWSTCLEWWAVDVYVTARGEIAAVTLDLWEP